FVCSKAQAAPPSADRVLSEALSKWAKVIEPAADQPVRAFTAKVKVIKADGLPKELLGVVADVAYQAPDRLRVSTAVSGHAFTICRDGQQVWIHEPSKKFAVLGKPGEPLFRSHPDEKDETQLAPFTLSQFKQLLPVVPW